MCGVVCVEFKYLMFGTAPIALHHRHNYRYPLPYLYSYTLSTVCRFYTDCTFTVVLYNRDNVDSTVVLIRINKDLFSPIWGWLPGILGLGLRNDKELGLRLVTFRQLIFPSSFQIAPLTNWISRLVGLNKIILRKNIWSF